MSNLRTAFSALTTALEALTPAGTESTPGYLRYSGSPEEDGFGESDHRTFRIIPTNGIISRDEGLSRQNLISYAILELKFNRQYYAEADLYAEITDEIMDIQSNLSALSWGGGVLNVLFEGWDLAPPSSEDSNSFTASFQLRIIHDEPET